MVCSVFVFVKVCPLYIVMSSTSALSNVILLVSLMYPGLSFWYSVRKIFALYVSVNIPKISSMNLTKYRGSFILGSVSFICCSVAVSSNSNSARYIHAYVTAKGVPMAVPDICR